MTTSDLAPDGGEASLPHRWVAEEATGLDGGCVESPTSDAPPDSGLTIATLLVASSLALAQYGADVYQACYGSAGGRAGAEGLGAPVRTNH